MAVENSILVKIKPLIKDMFIKGTPVPQICEFFSGLNQSTVHNWIKKENWKAERDSKASMYLNTPDILMKALDAMLTELTTPKIDELTGKEVTILSSPAAVAKLSDAIAKIVKSIKSLSKDKDYLASIIFSLRELTTYMNELDADIYDSDFREKLTKLFTGFQKLAVEKYSPSNYK